MEKPSMGVVPEKIWKEKRIEDLCNAIQLRVKQSTSHPVPAEWIEELNKLRREIYGPPTKICFGKPGEENEFNPIILKYIYEHIRNHTKNNPGRSD